MPKLLYESSPGSSSCQRCASALSKRDRQAAAILVHAAVLLGAACSKLIQQVLQDLDLPYLHSQDAARTLRCLILKLAPLPLHGTAPFLCAESEAAWISPFPHYGGTCHGVSFLCLASWLHLLGFFRCFFFIVVLGKLTIILLPSPDQIISLQHYQGTIQPSYSKCLLRGSMLPLWDIWCNLYPGKSQDIVRQKNPTIWNHSYESPSFLNP